MIIYRYSIETSNFCDIRDKTVDFYPVPLHNSESVLLSNNKSTFTYNHTQLFQEKVLTGGFQRAEVLNLCCLIRDVMEANFASPELNLTGYVNDRS